MKQFPLLIFDMDGLMLDTERTGWLMWRQVMKRFGVQMEFDTYAKVIGTNQSHTRAVALDEWGDHFPVDAFLQAVWDARMAAAREQGVPRKPGLKPLLAELKARGTRCAVATSSSRESMEELLGSAGVLDAFCCTVCGDEVTHSKPHPEIFLKAASKAGVPPEQAVVLEDSPNGIHAAHAAGMRGIFVRDLVDLPPDAAAMACRSLTSLTQVLDALKTL